MSGMHVRDEFCLIRIIDVPKEAGKRFKFANESVLKLYFGFRV